MAEVVIRRCMMRVVRHGGWSWGRAPRQLADDAVRALPALVAAELERLLPDDAEGEIAAPLRVEVKTTLADLARWARLSARTDAAHADGAAAMAVSAIAALPGHHGIADGLRHALAALRLPARIATAATPVRGPAPSAAMPDARRRRSDVLALLVAWQAAAGLDRLLDALDDAVVQAWHRVVFESPGDGDGEIDDTAAPLPEAARALEAFAARARAVGRMQRLRLRLLAAGDLAVRTGALASRRAVRALIASALPLAAEVAPPLPAGRPGSGPSAARAAEGSEQRVASALPFLLLGPLHRIGWIGMLDATLAGAHLSTLAPALAAALAVKALPEPERGWRRAPDALRAAAAFAGDAQPEAGDGCGLARAMAPLMPALDAVVRRALVDGHAAGTPVLACAVDGVHLVVDPPGIFLMAHAGHAEALAALLAEADTPVFVPEEDADTRMLAALDAAGVAFVTAARPVRGEHWHALPPTRAPRLYSNRAAARVAAPEASVAERARDAWQALARRPAPGHAADPTLDRSLSLAAALSLSTIAWELWREREPTDSLLALERFGDLEGTVRFDAATVRVRLPLGKRFRDLERAGLLEDVPQVPWLDGRTVVFSGG